MATTFGILWPLNCLFFDIQILITPLVSCGHWIVCSLIYRFWLLLWYLVAIELRYQRSTQNLYIKEQTIQWPQDTKGVIRICISKNRQFNGPKIPKEGHCIVSSLIYRFWLLLWYLVAIELSVLWYTDSDYSFGILWPLNCLFFDIQILIRSNQNLYIKEQTIQWPQDTKGVIRICISKNRQFNGHKIPKE
jgi:hypothetical protein